jgi:hypothetical protein
LELHAIAEKKAAYSGVFAVAMTREERQRFLDGIRDDHGKYYKMLGTVNAEQSDCSRPDDRISIHAGIRESVGFAQLSRMVFGVMEEWMEKEIRMQVAVNLAAGDEMDAFAWQVTLANVLSEQGKHSDALILYEKNLEFRQRVAPQEHLNIGDVTTCLWVDVCFSCGYRQNYGKPCTIVQRAGKAIGGCCNAAKIA